jgi:hypothetical protein
VERQRWNLKGEERKKERLKITIVSTLIRIFKREEGKKKKKKDHTFRTPSFLLNIYLKSEDTESEERREAGRNSFFSCTFYSAL